MILRFQTVCLCAYGPTPSAEGRWEALGNCIRAATMDRPALNYSPDREAGVS